MNHYDYENLQNRGKPKPLVKYNEHHRLVLRALRYLQKVGGLATDEAIFDAIVKAKGPKAISPSGARTRRHELEEMKLARLVPHVKGRTRSGKKAATYRLTEKGLAQADREFDAAKQKRLDLERVAA